MQIFSLMPRDLFFLFFARFDEYDVSPLTVKALNAAGYIQMTKVQEATLSVCLQGKLSFLIKVLWTKVFVTSNTLVQ